MLTGILIYTTTMVKTIVATVARGYPLGEVFSPHFCNFIMDVLLCLLAHNGYRILVYADDLDIIVQRKYDNVVRARMQQ